MTFAWQHILYRMFNSEAELLYVGITNSLGRRMSAHALEKPWWTEVADVQVGFFQTRDLLEDAERRAILAEKPKYNIQNTKEPQPALSPHKTGKRGIIAIRLDQEIREQIEVLAMQETGGNVSEMLRTLLDEAYEERVGPGVHCFHADNRHAA